MESSDSEFCGIYTDDDEEEKQGLAKFLLREKQAMHMDSEPEPEEVATPIPPPTASELAVFPFLVFPLIEIFTPASNALTRYLSNPTRMRTLGFFPMSPNSVFLGSTKYDSDDYIKYPPLEFKSSIRRPIWSLNITLEQLVQPIYKGKAAFTRNQILHHAKVYLITCPYRKMEAFLHQINQHIVQLRRVFEPDQVWVLEKLAEECAKEITVKKPFRYGSLPPELRNAILEVIAKSIMATDKGYYIHRHNRRFFQVDGQTWRSEIVKNGDAWAEAGKSLLQVNKEMRTDFGKAFFPHVVLHLNVEFRRIPASLFALNEVFQEKIKRLEVSWVTQNVNDNNYDVEAAETIKAFPALEELTIEIDWLHARRKYDQRVDFGHWLAHTAGIQKLVRGGRVLNSIKVTHSKEVEDHRAIPEEDDREYSRKYLESYLKEHLVPTSKEYEDWPEKRASMMADVMSKTSASTPAEKDDIQRAMQYLGYPKKLVDATNLKTAYNGQRSLEIMDGTEEMIALFASMGKNKLMQAGGD